MERLVAIDSGSPRIAGFDGKACGYWMVVAELPSVVDPPASGSALISVGRPVFGSYLVNCFDEIVDGAGGSGVVAIASTTLSCKPFALSCCADRRRSIHIPSPPRHSAMWPEEASCKVRRCRRWHRGTAAACPKAGHCANVQAGGDRRD